jgi:hypothetical protein
LKSFVRLYKLPADQRNAHAQFNLGVLWEQGRGGLSKDDREAARLYQLAASSRINLARRWQACGNFERRGRSRGPVPDTAPLTLRANWRRCVPIGRGGGA